MLKDWFKFKINNLCLIVSLVLVIGGWVWAYVALREISLPLIVHFNNVTGINQVGYFWDLAKVGIFGIAAALINFLISVELGKRDRFLGKLTSAFTFFLGILIFVYFMVIISVN